MRMEELSKNSGADSPRFANMIRQRPCSVDSAQANPKDYEMEPLRHPGGEIKYSGIVQIIRFLLIVGYLQLSCAAIVVTQLLGVPLYWINRNLYYAYMALTKQSFGIFVTTLTQWFAPTVVRVSGDSSVAGQLRKTADGRIEYQFPDRLVLMANHQLYSDWIYLWWAAYTNQPKMHGHIYIILKESLKHIPVIGWGMRFYGFIFMSRKFATDAPRLSHRLQKLKEVHTSPISGASRRDPMWLILFPEGTNASYVTRLSSQAWGRKSGVKDLEHTLLPRSAGLFFSLNELRGTIDYVYDCTMAYEGVHRGEFGQDFYTLRNMFLRGQSPPSVSMYWRRFEVAKMPLDDTEKFSQWLYDRWSEKDALLEHYMTHGNFPATAGTNSDVLETPMHPDAYIKTEVKTAHYWEVCSIFFILVSFVMVVNLMVNGWNSTAISDKLTLNLHSQ